MGCRSRRASIACATACRGCGSDQLDPGDRVPDANTLGDLREALIRAGALDELFAELDRAITAAGCLPRGGQIVDVEPSSRHRSERRWRGLVAAPRQRPTDDEQAQIKEGRSALEVRPEKPAKARPSDVDARRTPQRSRAEARVDGAEPTALAVPPLGYASHVSIDRMPGIAGRQVVTDAARHDGGRLRKGLIQMANTARDVWAASAYRSAQNEAWLAQHGMRRRIHRPGAQGLAEAQSHPARPAPAAQPSVRASSPSSPTTRRAWGRSIRTIGLARARAAITLSDMAHNMTRWRWPKGRSAPH